MTAHLDSGPLPIGATFLRKYQIRSLIGRGGYAYVYHGHDLFLRRDVAIKILYQEGGLGEEMLYRGQTEAQILIGLKHPNIVEVIDAGIENGRLYIIMELLRGRPLRDALHEHQRLQVLEALRLFLSLAEGLQLAHGTGIIHRDLKPENIFITELNRAKLLDFGIAKIIGSQGWQTQRNVLHGTAYYFSPEQVLGLGVTPQSDIYMLGTTLFESLLGRHPCRAENQVFDDARLIALSHTRYEPPRLDELDRSIPSYVAGMVHQSIAKKPAQRFHTMQDFASEIGSCIERLEQELRRRGAAPVERDLWRRLKPDGPAGDVRGDSFALRSTDGVPDTNPVTSPSFAEFPSSSAIESRRTLRGHAFDPNTARTSSQHETRRGVHAVRPVQRPAAPPPTVQAPAPGRAVPAGQSREIAYNEPRPRSVAAPAPQRAVAPKRTPLPVSSGIAQDAGLQRNEPAAAHRRAIQRMVIAGSLAGLIATALGLIAHRWMSPSAATEAAGLIVETVPPGEHEPPAISAAAAVPAPPRQPSGAPAAAAPRPPEEPAEDTPSAAQQPTTEAVKPVRQAARTPARRKNPEADFMDDNLRLLEQEMQQKKTQRSAPPAAGSAIDRRELPYP